MQGIMQGRIGDLALVVAYLGLNSSLNLLNRWALGIYGFKFPILMTCCHMIFSFLMLLPFMFMQNFRSLHAATLKRSWVGITCIGCFMAINISLNNASLVHMTLSLNQVIRASIPVITAVLAICVEGRYPSRMQVSGLIPISMGVMVAVYEASARSSMVGITLCAIATVSNALMMTTSGRVLSEKLDVLRLTFYTAPVSTMVLLPIFLRTSESAEFYEYMQDADRARGAGVLLLLGSANALLYNAVHYLMIQRMNATTTTVLGNVKVVALMLLSSVMFGETREWSVRMFGGCFVTLGGFGLYSAAAVMQQQAMRREAEKARAAGGGGDDEESGAGKGRGR